MNTVNSAALDARQRECHRFAVLSYQGTAVLAMDFQGSVFHRTADVHYRPDPVGALHYKGIAADILRSNQASGVQAEMSWQLNRAHTLRAGLFGPHAAAVANNNALGDCRA